MTWRHSLTDDEVEVVKELRRRTIEDCSPEMLKDDTVFVRFCKARDFNLKQAEEMLRKHLQWRKEFQVDTILTEYKAPEVIVKYFPVSFIGYDKEGCPIRYIDVGGADNKGLLDSARKVDFIKYNIKVAEGDFLLCKKQTEKLGKPITKVLYIYNFAKLTFAQATHKRSIEMFLLGINTYQDNFPERMKIVFHINVSAYFTIVFNILKTVIDAKIMEKIHIFSTEGWREEVLKLVDEETLPAFLGGKRTDADGDPLCNDIILHGQKVPEHYRLRKSDRRLSLKPDVQRLNVTRFAKSTIEFLVKEPGCYLEWQFETKSKDIGFGVYLKPKSFPEDAKPIEMIPKQRIDTNYGPEVGLYKCEKLGTYIILFDNSYSWIYSKEIYYRIRVLSPNEQENEDWVIDEF